MESVSGPPAAGETARNGPLARWRWLWLPALLVIGTVLLVAANVLLWMDRTLLNTDEFVGTVDGVLDRPGVRDHTAEVLAARAAQNPELQARIDQRLTQDEDLAFLSPILNAQMEPLLEEAIRRLLDTELAGAAGGRILRDLHNQVVATLENHDSVLQIQGDRLVLDLNEIIDRLFEGLNLPQPEQLGGSQERGEIVLLNDSRPLQQAGFIVRNRGWIMFGLLAGAVVSLGLATAAEPAGERRLMVPAGVLVTVGLVSLVLVLVANEVLDSAEGEQTVLMAIVKALERNLELQSLLLVVIGALVIAIADHQVRETVSKGSAAVAHRVEAFGAVRLLVIAAAIAAVLIFIFRRL